jgi:hypothetical protein
MSLPIEQIMQMLLNRKRPGAGGDDEFAIPGTSWEGPPFAVPGEYAQLPTYKKETKVGGKKKLKGLKKATEEEQQFIGDENTIERLWNSIKRIKEREDERLMKRENDIDINDISSFYQGLKYNDIVPLMDSNLPMNEGTMLLLDKINRLKNTLGSYSIGEQTIEIAPGMKIGVEGTHTKEIGLGKEPLESMPYLRIGREPTKEEKLRNIAGLTPKLIQTGNEDFVLHTHDENEKPSWSHNFKPYDIADIEIAALFPDVKNSYILSENGLTEYQGEGLNPLQIYAVDDNYMKDRTISTMPFGRRKLIKKMLGY